MSKKATIVIYFTLAIGLAVLLTWYNKTRGKDIGTPTS